MLKDVLVIRPNGQFKQAILNSNNELKELYRLIGCSTIDIVERNIGGKYYPIVVDDEFLLKDPMDNDISAIGVDGSNIEEVLYGNIIIMNDGEEGEMGGLTSTDIARIERCVCVLTNERKALIYEF